MGIQPASAPLPQTPLVSEWSGRGQLYHKGHEQALKSLLRYLKGTRTYGLLYIPTTQDSKRRNLLSVYSDANAANEKNRKSISGDVHLIGTSPVSWHSKKQSVVALSTTEAEYIVATNASRHANWIRKVLGETKMATIRSLRKRKFQKYKCRNSASSIAEIHF